MQAVGPTRPKDQGRQTDGLAVDCCNQIGYAVESREGCVQRGEEIENKKVTRGADAGTKRLEGVRARKRLT